MALLHLHVVTWTAGEHQYVATWADALVPKAAADTATLTATEAVSPITRLASAVDTATIAASDASRPPVVSGVELILGIDTATISVIETASAVELVPKSASDTATPVITERWSIIDGTAVPKSASDTALLRAIETPIDARIITVDDQATPVLSEIATLPVEGKAGVDTATLVVIESWALERSDGDAVPVTASDTATLVATDAAAAILQLVVVTSSDTATLVADDVARPPAYDHTLSSADDATLAVTDTGQVVVVSVEVTASDTATLVVTEGTPVIDLPLLVPASDIATLVVIENARLSIWEAPPTGALPPGWLEREETELAGIAKPWRVEPGNVTPHQGWKKRTYWAVYDEKGNVRATDRWQKVARTNAWTQYHSGRWAA